MRINSQVASYLRVCARKKMQYICTHRHISTILICIYIYIYIYICSAHASVCPQFFYYEFLRKQCFKGGDLGNPVKPFADVHLQGTRPEVRPLNMQAGKGSTSHCQTQLTVSWPVLVQQQGVSVLVQGWSDCRVWLT